MDAADLISKKQVLELTGISYGQFYRWKRKGLIPESWFMRKSTFTGQETFLPRAQVLERIEKIKSLKDDHSLEELAEVLAPEVSDRRYGAAAVAQMDWISEEARAFFDELREGSGGYRFRELLFLTALERLRDALSDEELALAGATLLAHGKRLQAEGEFRWALVVGRKPFERGLAKSGRASSVSFCALQNGQHAFDPGTEIAAKLELHPILEELKLKLSGF